MTEGGEGRPRLVLADDHQILLDGVRKLLESEFDIVATVAGGREVVAAAENLKPDCVVLDIAMPAMNGIEAASRLHYSSPQSRLVILSQYSDKAYIDAAFAAGVSAYVHKQAAATELVAAIRRALGGELYLSDQLRAAGATIPAENGTTKQRSELTSRQREILQLVAEGKTAKEAAALLGVSVKTVEFHKAATMERLGVRTTAELTRYAVRRGIVSD